MYEVAVNLGGSVCLYTIGFNPPLDIRMKPALENAV
jgi:hypothetical protein